MRIKDFSWTHTVGKRPEVELYLFDVTSDELTTLRDLAAKGDKIKIESQEYLKPSDRDVEMTAARFGRSKIEFTPIRDIKVEKVIFNKPATIVFWSDNTKTVVVCGKDDVYDREKGFYIACAKKLFGNNYKAVGRMNKAISMAITKGDLK